MISKVDRSGKIPNNVDLAGDKRLQRALEHWLPFYMEWWNDMVRFLMSREFAVFLTPVPALSFRVTHTARALSYGTGSIAGTTVARVVPREFQMRMVRTG